MPDAILVTYMRHTMSPFRMTNCFVSLAENVQVKISSQIKVETRSYDSAVVTDRKSEAFIKEKKKYERKVSCAFKG